MLSQSVLYIRLTWTQRKWSYGTVTIVTDEGEDEEWHGTGLLSANPSPPPLPPPSSSSRHRKKKWLICAERSLLESECEGSISGVLPLSTYQEIWNLQLHIRVYNPDILVSHSGQAAYGRRKWLRTSGGVHYEGQRRRRRLFALLLVDYRELCSELVKARTGMREMVSV